MTKQYKVHYTADVWMTVLIDADSKDEAKKLWEQNEHYEQGYHPEEMGMENVELDLIEEVKWLEK